MFRQLVIAQLLLLAAFATGQTAEQWNLEYRGGYYSDDTNYMMVENQTMTAVLTGIGSSATYVEWKVDGVPVEKVIITRTPLEDGNYLCVSEARIEAKRDAGKLTYDLKNPLVSKFSIAPSADVHVLYPVPPEISVIKGAENFKIFEDGTYEISENEQFTLRCTGGGSPQFQQEWVDSAGLLLESIESTQVGKLKLARLQNKAMAAQSVNVTATRGMTSLGCRLTEPIFSTSHTVWFNFTVTYTSIVELSVSNSNCEQVTFSCQSNDADTEVSSISLISCQSHSLIIND